MKRGIFNAVSLVSFVLCLTTIGLWIRSRSAIDEVVYLRHIEPSEFNPAEDDITGTPSWLQGEEYDLISMSGMLYYYQCFPYGEKRATGWEARKAIPPEDMIPPPKTNFGFYFSKYGGIIVPYWALLLLFAIVPMISGVTYHQRRRRRIAGLCQRCGYDLRATPERCPECGTVPAAAK